MQPLAKEQFSPSHGPVVMSVAKKDTHDTIYETIQDNRTCFVYLTFISMCVKHDRCNGVMLYCFAYKGKQLMFMYLILTTESLIKNNREMKRIVNNNTLLL